MAQLTLEKARKILGDNAKRYSDNELAVHLARIRKLAENAYPIVAQKLASTSRK